MLGYISTIPFHNPLFLPINSRFATHPVGISESSTSTFAASHHKENSPASAVSDCNLFNNCRAHPLPACNGILLSKEIRPGPLRRNHLLTTRSPRRREAMIPNHRDSRNCATAGNSAFPSGSSGGDDPEPPGQPQLRHSREQCLSVRVQWRGRRSTPFSRTQHRCRRTPRQATEQRPESDQPADRAAAARDLPERSASRPLCPVAGQKCPKVCQGCE